MNRKFDLPSRFPPSDEGAINGPTLSVDRAMKAALYGVIFALLMASASARIYVKPPKTVDPQKNYVVYLHGAILTGTDGTAESPAFGVYEYEEILERFDRTGVEVISEIRGNDDLPRGAERVLRWIRDLKSRGVPSRQITVVGASMGGIIAGRVSNQMKDPEISYVLIACLYRATSLPPVALSGRVLAIRDSADKQAWAEKEYFANAPDLGASEILVTRTGLGHGLLFTPNDAWFLPTMKWLKEAKAVEAGAPASPGDAH